MLIWKIAVENKLQLLHQIYSGQLCTECLGGNVLLCGGNVSSYGGNFGVYTPSLNTYSYYYFLYKKGDILYVTWETI